MVGYSDNLNVLLSEPVAEVERKAEEHNAPRSVQVSGQALRGCKRTLDYKGDLLEKRPRGDEAALRMPVLRIKKLLLCGWLKVDFRIHGGELGAKARMAITRLFAIVALFAWRTVRR